MTRPDDDPSRPEVDTEPSAPVLGRAELFRVDPAPGVDPPERAPEPPPALPRPRRTVTTVDPRAVLELVAGGAPGDERLERAQRDLLGELERFVAGLEQAARAPRSATGDAPVSPAAPECLAEAARPLSRALAARLAVLRHALEHTDALVPALDPRARLGHACAALDSLLEVEPGEGLAVLEELADQRLLERALVNRVHVCPKCRHCQLNFRERCPRCHDLDIAVEHLVHHFRCGATALEREFRDGLDLVCPKCRKTLVQLGQDFERPHEAYACGHCQALFEEPELDAQCLACGHCSASAEVDVERVHRYAVSPLALRALELGRLTALDVDALLVDARLRVATPDFLRWELRRELERLSRYRSPFSFAVLTFEADAGPVRFLRDWSAAALRLLCERIAATLRPLDMVARLSSSRLGLLLPEADEAGLEAVRGRLLKLFRDLDLVDGLGRSLTPRLAGWSWTEPGVRVEDVLATVGALEDEA